MAPGWDQNRFRGNGLRTPPFREGASRRRCTVGLLVAAGAILSGCGVSRPWDQTPTPVAALPDRLASAGAPLNDSSCVARLVDPDSGTLFELARSTAERDPRLGPLGDYRIDGANRYGLEERLLVRVQCRTGRPLGSVSP